MTEDTRMKAVHLLRECHDTCLETFAVHSTKEGGNQLAREHIRRMLSCMKLCDVTANFLLRRSPLTGELCDLCAELCEQCATSCSGIGGEKMNQCATICKETARAVLKESLHLKAAAA